VVRGFRSFTYVVKLTEPGSVDLGELTLPFYDPERRRYEIAKAVLGKVEVTPGSESKRDERAKASPLETLGKARTELGPVAAQPRHLTDFPFYLWLIFGAPPSIVLVDGSLRLYGIIKRRSSAKRSEPRRLVEAALDEAKRLPPSDSAKAAALCERALFLAIEGGPGLRARALLRSELKGALERAGFPADQAGRVVALLDDCEKARFTQDASGPSPREWVARAEPLTRALLRHKPRVSS